MTRALDRIDGLLDAVRIERAALDKAHTLFARDHAPGFNSLDLLDPGETRLSGVFRWMLDERGSHGQGSAFRELFLDSFLRADLAGADWREAVVRCEVATAAGRRMDVLIVSKDGRRAVVIENKPWADWQERQLQDYWLDQGGPDGRATVLAFVGGVEDAQGHVEREWRRWRGEPSACPPSVLGVDFDAVSTWVDRCADAARPVRVALFLRDLAGFMRERIALERMSMSDANAIADLLLAGGADRIEAAREVAAALPLLFQRLTEQAADRVGGRRETVAGGDVIRLEADGVPLGFALFGRGRPWAGVTDAAWVDALRGDVGWGRPETRWPRWVYLDKIGAEGEALLKAARLYDVDAVAGALPGVARRLLGG